LSKNFYRKRKKHRFFCLASFAFLLVLLTIIPLRLAIAFHQAPSPQAILTLGGGQEREEFTAKFAQKHPNLEIWVSGGTRPDKARKIFQTAGIPNSKVHIDCRAVDTVTNFTSLVGDFKKRNLQHIYLITANFHMARASAIATFVLGSRGIVFTPIAITNQPINRDHSPESWHHTLRDVVRSIFWLFTGHTGASFRTEPITSCL
jgi:uncharacterized SAM-binding protein YcdF (DUF218 family)